MTEDRNRRAVSIEHLLVWAYHDQMVHRATRGGVELARGGGPKASSSSMFLEGAPIEASKKQGYEAAEDAWRIHDQVLKLPAITVDCGQDLAAARYHMLGQYRGADPPVSDAGTVDRSRRVWPTDGRLDINVPLLVMIHACKATRPDYDADPDFRLKPGPVVRHPKQKGGVFSRGWYCHVTAEGYLPGDAVQAFEQYQAWHKALERLVKDMQATRLTMFAVTTALPPPPSKPRLRA